MTSFDDICKEGVKRFIQTVAIIDDEATYNPEPPSQKGKDKKKAVKLPVTRLTTDKRVTASSATKKKATAAESKDNHDYSGQLDAKIVVNAFADLGIVCCIQQPKHEGSPRKRAINLATSADVLVLDWVLDKKNMSLPLDIIKGVLKEDKSKGGRMRLIVVYTSHNYIHQMLKDIKKVADKVYDKGRVSIDQKSLVIKSDCLRIVILNKKSTDKAPSDARIVPFNELPGNILSEYVELVKGIIPGATLHGIAAIREKTHELLTILNGNLDGAYCLHRALLPEPSDSVDFALNLITSEIETVIQTDTQARQIVDKEGLKLWLQNHLRGRDQLPCDEKSLSAKIIAESIINGQLHNKEALRAMKRDYSLNWIKIKTANGQPLKDDNEKTITLDKAKEYIKQNKWERIKGCNPPNEARFAEVLYDTSVKTLSGCNELSHLQCTTRDIEDRLYTDKSQSPRLQLGTILKKQNGDSCKWFLCLTALCDCVRLENETDFFFLQLHPGDKEHTDIIVKIQDGTFEPLRVKDKDNKLRTLTIPFKPTNGSGCINASRGENGRGVKSNGISYQWMGELRYTKALAIVHYVVANTSRVGIDEFEWLRRQASIKN